MDEGDVGTLSTCGGCDYRRDGFIDRCHDPALYRADYRWLGGDGEDYTISLCPRHAMDAYTHDSLKRIYSAGHRQHADGSE